MTLYLKYRPQTIDELDLASVRETLKNIVKSGNIPHAFLFSGPKGTGKTSAARILAKIINCENLTKDGEPCNKCDSCVSITKGNNIDIIELDAASNRGIDDIRNLKEGIYLTPAHAKKKVYIIDEVHMLTLEAANAFLKTLEEPPDHVVFILATTNPEKLPETVISRLTQVNFTKANDEDIARQLNRVARGEDLKIEASVITKISKLADGSFRDAVKILENLSFKTKDIKEVDLEGILPGLNQNLIDFLNILSKHDSKEALSFIENLVQKGVSTTNFTQKLLEKIHDSLLAKNGINRKDFFEAFNIQEVIFLNELIIESKNNLGPISQLPLEIAVVKFCLSHKTPVKDGNETKTETVREEIKVEVQKEEKKLEPKIMVEGEMDQESWNKLLEALREKNIKLETLLRVAKPMGYNGKNLVLGVYYQFHKERLEDIKNTQALENICKESLGIDSIKISYQLLDKPAKTTLQEEPNIKVGPPLNTNVDKDIIDAAKEIFG